jgi:hypothetical protein
VRKFIRAAVRILIVLLASLLLLPLVLYIPAVQRYVCQRVVSALNDNEMGWSYSVGEVRIQFPLEVNVRQVSACRAAGDTILYVERLHTGLNSIPLLEESYVVNRLGIEGVVLNMATESGSLALSGKVEQLVVRRIEFDPDCHRLHVGDVGIENFAILMTMLPSEEPDTVADEEPSPGWDIAVGHLKLQRGEYLLDRPASAFFLHTSFDKVEVDTAAVATDPILVQVGRVRLEETMCRLDLDSTAFIPYYDYNHMDFRGIRLDASGVYYASDHIAARLHSLAAEEQNCGMQIEDVAADFRMDSSLIRARDFRLEMPARTVGGVPTAATSLKGDVVLDYNFFMEPHPGVMNVQLQGQVSGRDVVCYTAPYLPDVAQYWPLDEAVQLDVDLYANLDTLRVTRCEVSAPGWAEVSATAHGTQPFSGRLGRWEGSLECTLLHADSLVSAFVARPEQRAYCLPDSLYLDLAGGLRSGHYYLDGALEQGEHTSLTLEGSYTYNTESYTLSLLAQRLGLHEFVPALAIRQLDAEASVTGRRFDLTARGAELHADVRLDTLLASEKDHLTDVRLQGDLQQGSYHFTLGSDDARVGLEAEASGLLTADTLTSTGRMDIRRLQTALMEAFRDEDGTLSSALQWDLQSDWNECMKVDFSSDSLRLDRGADHWTFEDITLRFLSQPRYMSAVLRGGDCHATVQMDCGMGEIGGILDSLTTEVDRQQASIQLHPEALTVRLPQMDLRLTMEQDNPFYPLATYYGYGFSHLGLHLHNDRRLTLEALATDFSTLTLHYDTISAALSPVTESDYNYALGLVHTEPKLRRSYRVQTEGRVMEDSLTCRLAMVDGLETRMYDLGASLAMADDTLRLHFMDHPVIYAQALEVNPENYVQVTRFKNPALQNLGVEADLRMEGPRGFTLGLTTQPDDTLRGNRLFLNLHDLDLEYLGQTVQWGNPVAGVADLEGQLFVRPDSLAGLCDLSIDGRKVLAATYRDLRTPEGEELPIYSTLETERLPLSLVNMYMPDNMPLGGYLNGHILYTGPKRGAEQMQGRLSLDSATVRYTDADVTLNFPTDTLRLEGSRLLFDKWGITAAAGSPLLVDGVVDLSEELSAPKVNLTLKGNNLTLMRSPRRQTKEQYICGTLPANVNLRLAGVSPDLMLSGSVSALTGSQLEYYLQEDPLKSDSKLADLVEFVEFSKLNKHTTSLLLKNDDAVGGFGVNIRIDVARNAALDIHLSTTSDDNISVRGGGSLQFSMATDGTTHLGGTYDITSGDVSFKLPMLPVSKSFDIEDGSFLRWNGETENPELDITASEEVRCTINDESGVSRVVKFVVYVYIQGTMDDLSLTFSCAAPEDASLQNQISSLTEEERSKQAIRLLVTQSYSGPGVSTSSSLASASGAINALLQQEVESFFNQHMKNTQISVGIDTYDADGTGANRTDYSVKISQSLFNDRMRIVVGGRVSSGEESGSNSDNAIINDFSLEWLLREDGGHYLRLFRKTNYESILEGEIVETGVGYVVQRSSYRLLDLLIPSSEKRRQRIMDRIRLLDLQQHQLPALDSLLTVPALDSIRSHSAGEGITKETLGK